MAKEIKYIFHDTSFIVYDDVTRPETVLKSSRLNKRPRKIASNPSSMSKNFKMQTSDKHLPYVEKSQKH